MAQQPNIEVRPADRPRPVPEPGAAAGWRPGMRPGVIQAPGDVPRGGSFGTPGPDAGWALKLVRRADLPDRSEELEQVLAALAGARAAHFGRAPVPVDVEVAKLLAGIGEGLPEELAARRGRWIEATAHERSKGRGAVAEVDLELLVSPPEIVRATLTGV